jgi:hypothetical protein
MASFLVRQNLTRGDLRLFLSNLNGYAQNAFSVRWTVYAANGAQVSGKALPAIKARVGEYYAPWCTDVRNGSYRISWEVQEVSGCEIQHFCEGFFVVDPSSYIHCLPPSGNAIPAEGYGTFLTGSLLGRGDLPLYLKNGSGYPENAYVVFWTIIDAVGRAITSKSLASLAVTGEYYAQWPVMVGSGNYTILWEYQQDVDSPMQSAKMRFSVVCPAAPYVVMVLNNGCPSAPIRLCSGVIVVNCPPIPYIPPPSPSPGGDCCDFEIPRTIHIPNGALPPAGAYTVQPNYIIPKRIRHVTFYINYTRGFTGGFTSLRLMWGNGTEETQETLLNTEFTPNDPYSDQSLYLQDLDGPIPQNNSPVSFMIEAAVPGGATTVRLLASEGGVPGSPGTLGITLTASTT